MTFSKHKSFALKICFAPPGLSSDCATIHNTDLEVMSPHTAYKLPPASDKIIINGKKC